MKTVAEIEITTEGISLNGHPVETSGVGADMLNEAYRHYVNDYPKFFKMDGLSKLGFLASELLLQQLDEERFVPREDRAMVLFNRSGSIEADRHYQSTISDADNFFPSPSVFVYTLPNIVTGEIAMRNHYHGETSFYIIDEKNDDLMKQTLGASFADIKTKSMIGGWIDYQDDSHFEADIYIVELTKH
jgi:3-oxoacyl-[acyl-carrier-protein] synthase-1